jgi:hypothetical protein
MHHHKLQGALMEIRGKHTTTIGKGVRNSKKKFENKKKI